MTPNDVDPVIEPQSLRDEVAEILAVAAGRVTIGGIRDRLRHFTATPSQLLDVLDELVASGSADRFAEPGARALYQWVPSKPVRLPAPRVRVRPELLPPSPAAAIEKPRGTQHLVVDLLKDGTGRQSRQIAEEIGVALDRVQVALSNLKSAGKVTRDSSYPATWSLTIGSEEKPQQQSRSAAIYDFIVGAGRPVRACEISKAVGLTNSNTWNRLQFLIANGLVRRTADGHYELSDGPKPQAPAATPVPMALVDMPRKLALLSELSSLLNPKIAELLNDIRRDLQRFGNAQEPRT